MGFIYKPRGPLETSSKGTNKTVIAVRSAGEQYASVYRAEDGVEKL